MARQFNSAGTHLGYRYVDSPVIVPDGSPEPPDDPTQVVPSTWPGSRAPHAFTGADTSLRGETTLDWFGRDFVLVQTGEADGAPLMAALQRLRAPVTCRHVEQPWLRPQFERALVLVRPDGHVAWRGDAPPADPEGVARRVCGHPEPGVTASEARH